MKGQKRAFQIEVSSEAKKWFFQRTVQRWLHQRTHAKGSATYSGKAGSRQSVEGILKQAKEFDFFFFPNKGEHKNYITECEPQGDCSGSIFRRLTRKKHNSLGAHLLSNSVHGVLWNHWIPMEDLPSNPILLEDL